MQEKGILFGYDEDAARLIARKSFGNRSGGRAIRRTIRREVEAASPNCWWRAPAILRRC